MAVIGYSSNVLSYGLQRRMGQNASQLSRTLSQLSSGQRIVNPSDDAAGLAVSSQLRSRSRVFTQAIRNANDGLSALSIADGTLSQLSTIGERLQELANQAANGVFSRVQRLALDGEAYALSQEFNRLVSSTKFNGMRILDGSQTQLNLQLGYGNDERIGVGLTQELDRLIGSGFTTAQSTDGTLGLGSLKASAVGDINNDGIMDVVTGGNSLSNAYSAMTGNGNGTFTVRQTIVVTNGASLTTVRLADFNSDGKLDLIGVGSAGNNVIEYFQGNGDGTFQATVSIASARGNDLAVADFNNDGYNDIANLRASGGILVHYGNGSGSFTSTETFTASTGTSFAVADYNGDGLLDFALTTTTDLRVRLAISATTYASEVTYSAITNPTAIASSDFNHDGIPDLAVVSSTNQTISILRGNSDGTFNSPSTYSTGISMNSIKVADMNGDGNTDIIVASAAAFGLFTSIGDGTFNTMVSYSALGTFARNGLAIGDFNSDGVNDVLGNSGNNVTAALASTTATTSIQRFDLTTQAGARQALTDLSGVLDRIRKERGSIGSAQSRLNTAVENLFSSTYWSETAASRITDIDMAETTAQFTRQQILSQIGTGLAAQANLVPALALKILQSSVV